MNSSEVKIVMVGDSMVGKTSIVSQYCKGIFDGGATATLGAYFITKIPSEDRGTCMHIWDTAGQEKYRCLVPMYLRGANAAVIVIDGSDAASYDSIAPWYDALNDVRERGCLIYLAVNKSDLEQQVSIERVNLWADEHDVPVFVTTATLHSSVSVVFEKIADDLMARKLESQSTMPISLTDRERKSEKSRCAGC